MIDSKISIINANILIHLGVFDKFINNINKQKFFVKGKHNIHYVDFEENVMNTSIKCAFSAFTWKDTPEGDDYWDKISDEYEELFYNLMNRKKFFKRNLI